MIVAVFQEDLSESTVTDEVNWGQIEKQNTN